MLGHDPVFGDRKEVQRKRSFEEIDTGLQQLEKEPQDLSLGMRSAKDKFDLGDPLTDKKKQAAVQNLSLKDLDKEAIGELDEEAVEKLKVKDLMSSFTKKSQAERVKQEAFDFMHNTRNHSDRFIRMVNEERRKVCLNEDMYALYYEPDAITMGSEYKSFFENRISEKDRAKKKKNKRSRLYQKEQNAKHIADVAADVQTSSFDPLNRAMTKQPFLCEAEDYNDLAMFMEKSGQEEKNRELVDLYLGKSLKKGPGGFEGRDVQKALDTMAAKLFSIDVRDLRLDNDEAMVENAPVLERLSGQVAAFDRMAGKHNFFETLDEEKKQMMTERLNALRAIAAYYNARKDVITDQYFRDHYNDELSEHLSGDESKEQKAIAEKLEYARKMAEVMRALNGGPENGDPMLKARIGVSREILGNKHRQQDEKAGKELYRLQQSIAHLNEIDPLEEKKNIQKTMNKVMDRAFTPVQRPANRTGTWAKFKNRAMLGYRWVMGATFGTLSTIAGTVVFGARQKAIEGKILKNAQEKRRHDIVPGRSGETFKEEIVRKDEQGEDLDIYSDVRRGPLIWEKLSAGDPEDPPEVTLMIKQARRGSTASMVGLDVGHAFIGLSYSRYNKATKRKERYQLKMGFYPVGGSKVSMDLAWMSGAFTGGAMRDDSDHDYDVARRYQVKPGDINKILRASETYADKGYGVAKRNCTTYVVDMANLIGLSVSKEFRQDEFSFSGIIATMGAETGTAVAPGVKQWGANYITSQMAKKGMQYENFGQTVLTKEDLDRYYKTFGKGDSIKKGYSPGSAGETLKQTEGGDLTAYYGDDNAIDDDVLSETIINHGTALWTDIMALIPEKELSDVDGQMKKYFTSIGDGGFFIKMNNHELDKASEIRKLHKNVSTAIKNVNQYYAQRLGNDARLSAGILRLLGLYERVLMELDILYREVVVDDAGGDLGRLRTQFAKTRREVLLVDTQKEDYVTAYIPPGIFEGYLMMGKTTEEAIRDHSRYSKISKKKETERTPEEKEFFEKGEADYNLAKQFAKANRYLLDKGVYDETDVRYAFQKLPAMERAVSKDIVISGLLVEGGSPSYTYRSVIFERICGNMRSLELGTRSMEEDTAILDAHLLKGFLAQPELTDTLLKVILEGKEGSVDDLVKEFLQKLRSGYMEYVCSYMNNSREYFDDVVDKRIAVNSGSKDYLASRIEQLKKAGGKQQ